jgi:hypothetical protein
MPSRQNRDSRPLLVDGFHPITLEQVRALCVTPFAFSNTRSKIMDDLLATVARFEASGLRAEIWIDGSFLTATINPNDVDLLLALPEDFHETATPEQTEILNSLGDDSWPGGCDISVLHSYPEGHLLHERYVDMRVYWCHQFGLSRKREAKGIATVRIGGGT